MTEINLSLMAVETIENINGLSTQGVSYSLTNDRGVEAIDYTFKDPLKFIIECSRYLKYFTTLKSKGDLEKITLTTFAEIAKFSNEGRYEFQEMELALQGIIGLYNEIPPLKK